MTMTSAEILRITKAIEGVIEPLQRIAVALEAKDAPMSSGAMAFLSELENYTVDSRGRIVAINMATKPNGIGEPE